MFRYINGILILMFNVPLPWQLCKLKVFQCLNVYIIVTAQTACLKQCSDTQIIRGQDVTERHSLLYVV